jgi:hypothetical protein
LATANEIYANSSVSSVAWLAGGTLASEPLLGDAVGGAVGVAPLHPARTRAITATMAAVRFRSRPKC